MTYTYGSRNKIKWTGEIQVSEDYELQKGEYGLLKDMIVETGESWTKRHYNPWLGWLGYEPHEVLVSEKEIFERWKEELLKNDPEVEVIYARIRLEVADHPSDPILFIGRYHFEEVIIKGSPVEFFTLIAIIVIVGGIIGVSLIIFARPVLFKLADVEPWEGLITDLGTWGILLLIVIALVILAPAFGGVRVPTGGKK